LFRIGFLLIQTVNAANNGLDLEMPVSNVFSIENLKKAIAEGKVSETTINDKVRRILRVKFMAGLFDTNVTPDTTILTGEGHKNLPSIWQKNGIVLLKKRKRSASSGYQ